MFLEFYLLLLQCHILDLYFSSSVEDSWIRLQIKHIIKPFREGFFFKVTFGLYLKLQSHWEKCIYILIVTFHSVQSLSHVQLCDPWTVAHQASLSITNSWSLLKLMSIESVMLSNHHMLCHPLLLLPSVFLSIRDFSDESLLHIRWWKHWSFSFSISPSSEYSGLISFRMDWLDLLAVQGTLKSLLQHPHHINSSALSFLHSPTLTSIHDHWKNHSLD